MDVGIFPLLTAGLVILLPLIYYSYFHIPSNERALDFKWTAPPESTPGWKGFIIESPNLNSHLTNATLLPSNSSSRQEYITAYAPASAYHLSTIPTNSKLEISEIIAKSVLAQKKWSKTTFSQRRQLLRSLLKWIVRDKNEISQIASRDTGKTMIDAAFGEILTSCEKLRWTISEGEKCLKPESRSTNLLLAHKKSWIEYEPLGVVAACVSWNYSFHNILSPIISALMTGNTIVVKPSENVVWSTQIYIQAIRDIISKCGHDPDIVQLIIATQNTVEALTKDERIAHTTFIGSETVGRIVAQNISETGRRVLLELGGKDPCLILSGTKLNNFYDTWMRSNQQGSGQNCIAAERFIVHSSLYDQFTKEMSLRFKQLKQGDVLYHPSNINLTNIERTDVGAMVSDRLFPQLESLISEAVEQGAKLLVGGKRYIHPILTQGHYFQPTLLINVLPTMKIAQEELFAPVMLVMSFETEEQAIEIANGTRYGLGASVFGNNEKICNRVARELKSGMVCTNDFGVFYLNQALPFGGTGASGYGRFGGPEGLKGLCNMKSWTVDRFFGTIQTSIPPLLRYPINSGKAGWEFVSGLIEFGFGEGNERLSGLWKLVMAKP